MKIKIEIFDKKGKEHRITIDDKVFDHILAVDTATVVEMAKYTLEHETYQFLSFPLFRHTPVMIFLFPIILYYFQSKLFYRYSYLQLLIFYIYLYYKKWVSVVHPMPILIAFLFRRKRGEDTLITQCNSF